MTNVCSCWPSKTNWSNTSKRRCATKNEPTERKKWKWKNWKIGESNEKRKLNIEQYTQMHTYIITTVHAVKMQNLSNNCSWWKGRITTEAMIHQISTYIARNRYTTEHSRISGIWCMSRKPFLFISRMLMWILNVCNVVVVAALMFFFLSISVIVFLCFRFFVASLSRDCLSPNELISNGRVNVCRKC